MTPPPDSSGQINPFGMPPPVDAGRLNTDHNECGYTRGCHHWLITLCDQASSREPEPRSW
jgi:hypothetical protein